MPEVPQPRPAPPPPECPAQFPEAPPSSYELQNSLLRPHRGPIRYRAGLSPEHARTGAPTVAYGDFNGDELEDFFVAVQDGSPNPRPVEMWLNTGDGYRRDEDIWRSDVPGLVHPRKLIPGDFNGDGRLDIFVAGHGYDHPPFPGEWPALILSTEDGGLRDTGDLREHVGFLHGAASADIDLDGDLDVFVTDTRQPFILRNDGTGRMEYDVAPVPSDLPRHVYTVEFIDVNEDGVFDLLVGGQPPRRGLVEEEGVEVVGQEVAGRVVRDVDIRETVGVKLDALRAEIRLVWGALGVLVTVLIAVLGFLFAD